MRGAIYAQSDEQHAVLEQTLLGQSDNQKDRLSRVTMLCSANKIDTRQTDRRDEKKGKLNVKRPAVGRGWQMTGTIYRVSSNELLQTTTLP